MRRFLILATAVAAVHGAAPRVGQAQDKPKITVAVMNFTAAAMIKRDQYEALSDGIPLLLGAELVTHPSINLVEREQLQRVMDEIKLGRSDVIDPQKAVQVGKLLNAQYLVMGGFLVDPREEMELTSRVVEVETGQIRSATKVKGKGQDIFELIAKLTKSLSPLLSIEPPPGVDRGADGVRGDDVRGMSIYQAAERARLKGNKPLAIELARNAMQVSPGMAKECREMLQRLGAI
jgi:TolB-like protein